MGMTMKRVLAALLLLLCTAAHAQAPRPPCYPYISGPSVGTPKSIKGAEGTHVYWFCSAAGKVESYGFSYPPSAYSWAKALWIMQLPTRATRREETANATWDANTYDLNAQLKANNAQGRLARERLAIFLANRTAWGVQ